MHGPCLRRPASVAQDLEPFYGANEDVDPLAEQSGLVTSNVSSLLEMKLLAHQYRQAALLRQSQPAMGREIAVIERGEGRNGPVGGLSIEKLSFSQAERNLLPLEATRDDRRSKDSD